MARLDRLKIIREIETCRSSRVLVYITGDRQGFQTIINTDTFPFIAKHLAHFKRPSKIDLFLYSTGGNTMAGYSLVNMIREHTSSFSVLIPFKALSTATLITMGADDIRMTKMGQLSPIDPSFSHPLGPSVPVPGQPGVIQPIPVSVEDIFNYIELARTELKINDVDSLERVLENLANNVHPLILGHGYRMREQTGFLAHNLLSTHLTDEKQIKKIIEVITRGRYSHDYIFSRKEAKDVIKLPIIDDERVESLVFSLFEEYQSILELPNPYSPDVALGEEEEALRTFESAIIESDDLTHVFRTQKFLRRINVPVPGTPVQTPAIIERVIKAGWVEDNSF